MRQEQQRRRNNTESQYTDSSLLQGTIQPTRSSSPAPSTTGPRARSSTPSPAASRRRSSSQAQPTKFTTRCASILSYPHFSTFPYYDALLDSSTSLNHTSKLEMKSHIHTLSEHSSASACVDPENPHVAITQAASDVLADASIALQPTERALLAQNLEEEPDCP